MFVWTGSESQVSLLPAADVAGANILCSIMVSATVLLCICGFVRWIQVVVRLHRLWILEWHTHRHWPAGFSTKKWTKLSQQCCTEGRHYQSMDALINTGRSNQIQLLFVVIVIVTAEGAFVTCCRGIRPQMKALQTEGTGRMPQAQAGRRGSDLSIPRQTHPVLFYSTLDNDLQDKHHLW